MSTAFNTVVTILIVAVLIIVGYLVYQNYMPSSSDTTAIVEVTQNPTTTTSGSTSTSTAGQTSGGQSGTGGSTVSGGTTVQTGQTAAIKTFTITGQNFSFAPSAITVNRGDRVKIIFKNASGVHDLKIDGLNVGTSVIQGGQEATFEFVASTAGTFEYYCSVGSHRAMGMKGTLVVN